MEPGFSRGPLKELYPAFCTCKFVKIKLNLEIIHDRPVNNMGTGGPGCCLTVLMQSPVTKTLSRGMLMRSVSTEEQLFCVPT